TDYRLPVSAGNREPATGNEVFGVSGAAAVYRKSFINDVTINDEYFDEDFFSYREDADVAWRGRLFGWRALLVPEAIAYHVRAVTPERRRSFPTAISRSGFVEHRHPRHPRRAAALRRVRNICGRAGNATGQARPSRGRVLPRGG